MGKIPLLAPRLLCALSLRLLYDEYFSAVHYILNCIAVTVLRIYPIPSRTLEFAPHALPHICSSWSVIPLHLLLVLFSVKHTDHFGFIYCADGRSRTYNFNHHWHQITKRGSIQPRSTFRSLSCLIFVLPHCCRFFAGKDLLSFSG